MPPQNEGAPAGAANRDIVDILLQATPEDKTEERKPIFMFARSVFNDITFQGMGPSPESVNNAFSSTTAQENVLTAVIKTLQVPQIHTTFQYQTTEDDAVRYAFSTSAKRWEEDHIRIRVTEFGQDEADEMSLGTIPTVGTYTEKEAAISTSIFGKAYELGPFEAETTNRAMSDQNFSNRRKAAMLSVEGAITDTLFKAMACAKPTWAVDGPSASKIGAVMTRSALVDAMFFPKSVSDGRHFSTVELRGADTQTNRALGILSSIRDKIIGPSNRVAYDGPPVAASIPRSILLADQTMRDLRTKQSSFGIMSDYFDEASDYFFESNMFIGSSQGDNVSKRMAKAFGKEPCRAAFADFVEEQRDSPGTAPGPRLLNSRTFGDNYSGDGIIGRAVHSVPVSSVMPEAVCWDEETGELAKSIKCMAMQVTEFAAERGVAMPMSKIDRTRVFDPLVTEERSPLVSGQHYFGPTLHSGAVFAEFLNDSDCMKGANAYLAHCMRNLGAEKASDLEWLIACAERNLSASRMPYRDSTDAWMPLRFFKACQSASGNGVMLGAGVRDPVGFSGMTSLLDANGTFASSADDADYANDVDYNNAGERKYALGIGSWKSDVTVVIPSVATVPAFDYFLNFAAIDPVVYATWVRQLTEANSLAAYNAWIGKVGRGLEALSSLTRNIRAMHGGNGLSGGDLASSTAHLYASGDFPAPFLSESYLRTGPSGGETGEAGYNEKAAESGVLDALLGGDRCGIWLSGAGNQAEIAALSILRKLMLAAGVEDPETGIPAELEAAAAAFLEVAAPDFITRLTTSRIAAVVARYYENQKGDPSDFGTYDDVDANTEAMETYALMFENDLQRYTQAVEKASSSSKEYEPLPEAVSDLPQRSLHMARAWPVAAGHGKNVFARYAEFAEASTFRRTSFVTRYSSMASALPSVEAVALPGLPQSPSEWPSVGSVKDTMRRMRAGVSTRLPNEKMGSLSGSSRACAQRVSLMADNLRRSTPFTRRLMLAKDSRSAAAISLYGAVPMNGKSLAYISENVAGGVSPLRVIKVAWGLQFTGQAGFMTAKSSGIRIIGVPTSSAPQSLPVESDLDAGVFKLFFASGDEASVKIDPRVMIESRTISATGVKSGFFMCSTGASIVNTDEFVSLPLASVVSVVGGFDPLSYAKKLPDEGLFDGETGHNLVFYTAYSAPLVTKKFSMIEGEQAFPGHAASLYLADTQTAFRNSCGFSTVSLDNNTSSMKELFSGDPCFPINAYPAPAYVLDARGNFRPIATGNGPISHIKPPIVAPVTTPGI